MATFSQSYISGQLKIMGFNVLDKNKNFFVVCPFHKDSADDGGSMAIKKNGSIVKCFSGACGWVGTWEKFVAAMGGEHSDLLYATKDPYGMSELLDVFGGLPDESVLEVDDKNILPRGAVPWTKGDWRGIKQKTLTKVNTHYWYDDDDSVERILWPITYRGEVSSWTSRTIELDPPATIGKHKHEDGFRSTKYMGFLEYAEEKGYGVLVEGVTDALANINVGIPGIPIFGTNSWSDTKVVQIIALNLEFLITGLDNDKAGRACKRRVRDDLGDKMRLFEELIPKKPGMKKRPDFGNVEEVYPGYMKDFKRRIKLLPI